MAKRRDIHILGIGGSFMAGLASLAREIGFDVQGTDIKVYPPMSTQLAQQGIFVNDGYDAAILGSNPDVVVIGNALSRGNVMVEAVLDRNLNYSSGAQWLADHVLPGRWVMAVAGTHGKTTTASMLAWILEFAGLNPGFLIGGIPENFGVSARLGDVQGSTSPGARGSALAPRDDVQGSTSPGARGSALAPRDDVQGSTSPGADTENRGGFFVIEADEYDTAFFDKRSKFVHYRPRTAVLNNLEFDHADIFSDLSAIKVQFHHLIRTVPASGLLIVNGEDKNLMDVLGMGCWTPVEQFDSVSGWQAEALEPDGSRFRVSFQGSDLGTVAWPLIGNYNISNALAAIAAARHAGVPASTAVAALGEFRGVRRRLEIRGTAGGVTVYDDFAHHPTAISSTLTALRSRVGDARIFAVLEMRSNSMRMGVHRDTLAASLSRADRVLILRPQGINWNIDRVISSLHGRGSTHDSVESILKSLSEELKPADHVLVMSNGSFEHIHARLLDQLDRPGEPRPKGEFGGAKV
jgi:UDP-N-acetylmuramate: L-alanyl-gamma-D-glutamyl-meso-diaminopimelate ligase